MSADDRITTRGSGPTPDAASDPAQPAANATRVIRSEELFAGRRTVVIQHADAQYRLLITRNDRLILQK